MEKGTESGIAGGGEDGERILSEEHEYGDKGQLRKRKEQPKDTRNLDQRAGEPRYGGGNKRKGKARQSDRR
jgi:hypothetical protein